MSLTLRTSRLVAAALLAAVAGSGCQKSEPKTYTGEETRKGGVASGGSPSTDGQLVTIPVSLVDKRASNSGFSLLGSATTFDISLEDCATGYTSTADQDSTALLVYKFDRGCKAKLTGFEYNGLTYEPTVADPFTTWDANDVALFDEAGEPGTNAVVVKVLSQLADPVSGTEAVVYQFSELIKGADEDLLDTTVSAGHSMTVDSQPPPSFTIKSIDFVAVNAGGGGQFDIVLECTENIGVTDVCEDVDMADLTYKLIEDTYGSTLTIGQANAIFPADETAVAMPGDREAPGGATTNGGFHTITLDGPDQLALHPNMIFIIQAADTSYQYFNIDIETLTQD